MDSVNGLDGFITCPPDTDNLWSGQYKIPWNDPAFSGRMLSEHLSQDHDMASRKLVAVKKHVNWIHSQILCNEPAKLLDLGCGPGLYLKEFYGLGYDCRGIDFSPASIDYARNQLDDSVELFQGDIREQAYGSDYLFAMMVFGELNVFSPSECRLILKKTYDSLANGGKLLLELHTFDAVKSIGNAPNSWYKAESGLFSEHPHICLIENHWIEEQNTALQQFAVIDAQNGSARIYRSTTKAWTEEEYRNLLAETGFVEIQIQSEWPDSSGHFCCLVAEK